LYRFYAWTRWTSGGRAGDHKKLGGRGANIRVRGQSSSNERGESHLAENKIEEKREKMAKIPTISREKRRKDDGGRGTFGEEESLILTPISKNLAPPAVRNQDGNT